MYENKIIKAILLLGGNSSRFGDNLLKQCQMLSGKKVYLHTVDSFLKVVFFDEIILVSHIKCMKEVQDDLKNYPLTIPVKIVPGGTTRQESSFCGLEACGKNTDIVVIHDAVRPFVTSEIILENIFSAIEHQAVDTCIATADTLVEVNSRQSIKSIPDRRLYKRGQTPQSFSYSLIYQAHIEAKKKGLEDRSDDCQLILEMGNPVYYVEGHEQNIKITTELDLFLAEQLFRLRKESSLALKPQGTLLGKKYAIIGGTGGIGAAIANLLTKEGATPLVISRNSEEFSVDVTSYKQVETIFSNLFQKFGELDGLINSAGLLKVKQLEELSFHEIEQMLQVNLHGVIYSCRSVKLKQGGHIINIASSSYTRGRPHYSIYSCAKAAVVNFTQAFAEEHPHLNVNAIVPHRTKTALRTNNFEDNENDLLSPKEVAEQIINLLKYPKITGTIIEIRKPHEN